MPLSESVADRITVAKYAGFFRIALLEFVTYSGALFRQKGPSNKAAGKTAIEDMSDIVDRAEKVLLAI